VLLDGHDLLSPLTNVIALRRRVGMVFSRPALLPLSIYENVVYGLRVAGERRKAHLDQVVEKALRQAVKLKPEETLYQTELGAILIKLAKYDEAIKALKKAIELDAENSEAAELLEKAQAGKKRIDFGSTPKPQQPQDNAPKSKDNVKSGNTDTPETEEKPEKEGNKPGEAKPEKKPEKKLDKKGDQ